MVFGTVVDREFIAKRYKEGTKVRKAIEDLYESGKYIMITDNPATETAFSHTKCLTVYKRPSFLKVLPDRLVANFLNDKIAIIFPNENDDTVSLIPLDNYKSNAINNIINKA